MRDNIFNDLKLIQKEMLRLLGEVSTLTSSPIVSETSTDEDWKPKCDVYEAENELIVIIELPGMEKEDINLTISEEYIHVYGERFFCDQAPDMYYHLMEIDSGPFQRRIPFPEIPINKHNPTVTYANGLLRIAFERRKLDERRIEIK